MKSFKGLTAQQVLESRQRHGDNVLSPPPRSSLWAQFIEKFNDPLIKILLVALVLAVGLALWEYASMGKGTALLEPVGIFVAIVLATMVGFVVEVKANKKFELLNQSNDDLPVKVVRDGHIRQVPRRDVVVGDIVLLEAGERVPADGRLLHSVAMSVDESSLTGEPQAWKTHRPADEADSQTAYPANQLLRGSTVIEGNGVMQVERVGDATEYGRVATEAQIEHGVKTPLMQQLDRLGGQIARASYLVAAIIVVGRILAFFLDDEPNTLLAGVEYAIETVMIVVTLIVVSVPEGLPMSITLSLALSMHRMLRTGNLVRRMHACETMGAATVICTDKTGTLTENQMQVAHVAFPGADEEPQGAAPTADSSDASLHPSLIALSLACNSTAYLDDSDPERVRVIGNPTEGALLLWLRERGVDYLPLREQCTVERQVPFNTDSKYMATVVRTPDGRRLLLVKGAPELVMDCCRLHDDALVWQLKTFQRKAMRTLAFACATLPDTAVVDSGDLLALASLHFLGYVAISDPVRPDVPDAIRDCRRAGVKVKVITGDSLDTAREVARQVGIWTVDDDADPLACITGPEFAAMTDEQALGVVQRLKIMARARPSDKARLVDLLQQCGEVVAVTGDGTNDAPALKKAHVGLSMGDGTHVAREASDITILDNSFASINKAVLWGRSLYRNIQRFILFQLTVNVCACLVVGLGSFISMMPITVTQMLWVNLIMDTFAALALASLPPSSVVMGEPPRRRGESIITRRMARIIAFVGTFFAGVVLGMFAYFLVYHVVGKGGSVISVHISPQELAIIFTTFVMLQFWNLFNAKSFASGRSAFHNVSASRTFFLVAAVILFGQVFIVQVAYRLFHIEPINLGKWLLIVGGTSLVMLAGELVHQVRKNLKSGAKLCAIREK